MNNQTLDLKKYQLHILTNVQELNIIGGNWFSTAIRIFESLQIADAVNESIDGFTTGFNDAYYRGKSRGHGAGGTW